MATLRKAADISHKVVVTGLFAFTGYNFYQIAGQVMEGRGGNKKTVGEQTQAGFIDMLRKKAEEEYTKRFDITHRGVYIYVMAMTS
jgi:hypothetical protein